MGHQPGRIGGEQEPRVFEQRIQLTSLAGVQREVPPCVTVPAPRVGCGVSHDERFVRLGRIDQEVRILPWVGQEIGEGLVIKTEWAIRVKAVQELPDCTRHISDSAAIHRLVSETASYQPELLDGEPVVPGNGKRGENRPESS